MMRLRGQGFTGIKLISETNIDTFIEKVLNEIKNVNIVDYKFSVINSGTGMLYTLLIFVGETLSKA